MRHLTLREGWPVIKDDIIIALNNTSKKYDDMEYLTPQYGA